MTDDQSTLYDGFRETEAFKPQRGDLRFRPEATIVLRRWLAALLIVLLLALMAFFGLLLFWPGHTEHGTVEDSTDETPGKNPLDLVRQLSAASQRLSQRVGRAVVRVDAENITRDVSADAEIEQLFGSAPPAIGQGSGIVVQEDGFVLTNYHVVRGATRVSVVSHQKTLYPARIVGTDALTDLALLKIDARELDTIPWGDSDDLEVGAFVWAVGSPFGLEGSVSFGIVSAKNRDGLGESPFQEFLQTDAAVNPGNSGGPLIDADGRMVGVNTAILGTGFQGISFAIPSNLARATYQQLKEQGRVARGWLGVGLETVSVQRAAQLNLPAARGAYVISVTHDATNPSPAQQAGMRPGDVITHWNDQPVEDPTQLSRMVAQATIGIPAQVTVFRQEQELQLPVMVVERAH